MLPSDITSVVDLQVQFLDGSLLTDLGSGFLTSFYRAALSHRATRAFVAIDEGGVVGAAVGTVDVGAFNRHVRPRIIAPLALALLPPARWRLVGPLSRSLVESGPQSAIRAELLTLVVHGDYRQRGIARDLVAALEAGFPADGIELYRVAVRSHLDIARAFYVAAGFQFEQELAVLGRPMTYLTKRISWPGRPPRTSS